MSTTPRRPGALRILDRWVLPAEVIDVAELAPRLVRVCVAGDALRGLAWEPGQSTRVVFNDLTRLRHWTSLRDLREATRCYSIWDYDAPAGRLQLVVHLHGHDGPGTRWITTVRVGDPIMMFPIEGKVVLRPDPPYHLFVGDETAAVAFGAMLRAVDARAPVAGVLEAATADRHPDVPRSTDLLRVERDATAVSPSRVLVDAVTRLDLPSAPGAAYLAGEAKTVQAVRRHLIRDRGWSRSDIRAKAFWTPGRQGLD